MSKLKTRAGALLLAAALFASVPACSSDDAPSGDATTEAKYNPISSSGTAPGGDFIPTNSEESGRKTIAWLVFDGLTRIGSANELIYENAESVTTTDAITWTVKLKPNQLFANGEKLTVDNYIDAWTWGSNISNAQIASADLSVIAGYDKLHPSDGTPATATTFEGLTRVDDLTFTIKLSRQYSSFPLLLSAVPFFPLPGSFFDNPDAWRETPVGNGPYQLKGKIDDSDGAYFDVNPNYTGSRVPENDGVYIRFYTSPDAIYSDILADNLDLGSASGAGLLTAAADFGDRFISGPGGPTQTLTFPLWDEYWQSDAGLKVRQAISLAIDREQITQKVFNGLAVPAKEFTQPGLNGWNGNLPGSDILSFDPVKAKALLAEAGGFDKDLPIYYNADGAHKDWVEAVANQLQLNLGINAYPAPVTTFSEFLEQRANHEFTGPWRASEIPFNPGLDDILRNVYSINGGASSGSDWFSQEYEDLLAEGWKQTDVNAANAYFNQAQEVLLRELPAIPLWYSYRTQIHSTLVSNVQVSAFGSNTYLIHKES
ncbi:MAG: ABC transporter substrate-binding protein [Propionibacteriaceae bacterium]|nr:ABC transporter substrate-binding protein [Propionibacteriaceae bacterium]